MRVPCAVLLVTCVAVAVIKNTRCSFLACVCVCVGSPPPHSLIFFVYLFNLFAKARNSRADVAHEQQEYMNDDSMSLIFGCVEVNEKCHFMAGF